MSNHREQISSALKRAQLFAGLTEPEMQSLSARAVRKLYEGGELVFSEGEPCEGFYVVLTGKIRIFKTSANGREQVLAIEGPGSSVAELPVFDGGPYPASVSAVEDSLILFISRQDLRAFCLEHPEVALKMLAVVGARLRRLVGIIEELSFTTVRQRLVAALVRLAQTAGRKTPQGLEFDLPGTHQEIAHQLGTVRELVSRNLMRLQAEGLVHVSARSIVVPDLPALSALLEGNP
ncbi:MAG TPA: Crp/Fnr family transcriptional regulator [Acidobacteriaceae bacterium]|nr:Crp/Fnr family transcriptional regulator [Acidobacteriaceae bacterium]